MRHQYKCMTHATAPGRCVNNIVERDPVDRAAWELVTKILSQPDIIRTELQRITSEASDPTGER